MKLFNLFFSMLFLSLPILGFSEPTQPNDDTANHFLTFQIIQAQFIFNNQTVQKAALIQEEGIFRGLEIELKGVAVKEFTDATIADLGKKINIVLNNKVITTATLETPLGSKLLITGITKEDAQTFLIFLRKHQT